MLANAADVKPVQLESHGPTVQFKLLMGTTESKRDKLAAASQMVSLFIMDFSPTGTNIPHHHESEEEIYYVLRGRQRRAPPRQRGRRVLHPAQHHGRIL